MLMQYYGNDQMQQWPRPSRHSPKHLAASNASTTDPFGTFSAGGQYHAVTKWVVPEIEDYGFRMLEPYEVSAGMPCFPRATS